MAQTGSNMAALVSWGSRRLMSFLSQPHHVVVCEVQRAAGIRRGMCSDPNSYWTQKRQQLGVALKGVPHRVFRRKLREGRERIVVLGTGWAAWNFISQIDPTKFEVTVVSPRPYFLFTPLLASAVGGVLSKRSIIEPIRNKLRWCGTDFAEFLQASATDVEVDQRTVICKGLTGEIFKVPYDKLVCGVGAETNTFGVPGIKENACFIKEIEDAHEIRLKVMNAFERAALPTTTDQERADLLNIVVVGGGPAGVETAAELWDLIRNDMLKHYPKLVKFAKISLIEMLPSLLPVFDKGVQAYAKKVFKKIGIHTFMEHRLIRADSKAVHVVDKQNVEHRIPYGVFIWASGIGQVPFIKQLITTIPSQKGNRVLKVRPSLKVLGTENVFALGDCAIVNPPSLAERVDELFQQAATSPNGAGIDFLRDNAAELIEQQHVQLHRTQIKWSNYAGRNNLNREDFKTLLEQLDKGYKAPVATAQMARQAGAYLAASLNEARENLPLVPYAPINRGSMSYIGGGKAVIEFQRVGRSPVNLMGGWPVVGMWHGYYWLSQTSAINRILSLLDYIKNAARGRDLAEETFSSSADAARSEREKAANNSAS